MIMYIQVPLDKEDLNNFEWNYWALFISILIGKGTNLIINLLSLHVSLSQFRSRDFLNSPSINYASKCTWMGRHLNERVSQKPKLIQKLSC